MKYILIILFLSPLLSYSQDTTLVSNLQLKGGTVKIISALIYGSGDTSVSSAFFKIREDYIDGTPPNDNANVTISTLKTTTVAYMYNVLLRLPGGFIKSNDVLGAFITDINSKRNANSYLDRLCDELEAEYTKQSIDIISTGNKFLLTK